MILSGILSNEALRQAEFPVTRSQVFLAHAAVSPLARRVSEAIRDYASAGALGDQERPLFAKPFLHETRQVAAQLMQAQPEEIAFVGPTSLALSWVAAGLALRKRDNILIYHDDYPSNVYPWMALAERGIQVRLMNLRELGRIRPLDVLGQVDEQTKLVALASAHFISGWRLDLARIGQALRSRGVLFCVDAIQTLGAFPTTVENVDFMAADAHKWLLGPCAAGILYVRREVQPLLRPAVFGWHNVRCPDFVAQNEIVHPQDARRYEAGSANLLGLVGLRAAMELLLEVGVENIAAELWRKRQWLVPALQAKGYQILQADAPQENASGILSFHRPGTDMAAVQQQLEAGGIVVSLRSDRAGQHYLRVSPHFYNTEAELERLVQALP